MAGEMKIQIPQEIQRDHVGQRTEGLKTLNNP